jgi:hypothetical protein
MDESLELRLSLWVCLGLSAIYVVYALLAEPSGGQPFGHGLGIVGTLLMVSTETLYSLRKRTPWLRWAGPVRYWLSAHIFTGIVGPFLVLLHSAFEFRGLAGITMGLTALVMASGFLGRYLYTAIPRSIAGVETSTTDLAETIRQTQAALLKLVGQHSPAVQAFVEADAQRQSRSRELRTSDGFGIAGRQVRGDWELVFLRGWDDWRYLSSLRRQIRQLEKTEQQKLGDVEQLLLQRRVRERQLRMMQAARRMLSVWHTVHVPMGVALFTSVAIHVAATLYFGAGVWR